VVTNVHLCPPSHAGLGRGIFHPRAALQRRLQCLVLGVAAKPHEEGAKEAREKERGEGFWIELCGRPLPAKNTEDGIRAVKGTQVIEPGGVRRYLAGKFGDDLGQVRSAMRDSPGVMRRRNWPNRLFIYMSGFVRLFPKA
jgi:hypothetical protein